MTPEHTALVAELQKFSDHMYATSSPEAVELLDAAADRIRALAGEVERLGKKAVVNAQMYDVYNLLAERDTLRAEVERLTEDLESQRKIDLHLLSEKQALRKALLDAKETIHVWHGDVAWDIYERSSPEMKRINAALADKPLSGPTP